MCFFLLVFFADKIPTAPLNVVASFVDTKIKVHWDPPSRNAAEVTSYNIYYSFAGRDQPLVETVVSAWTVTDLLCEQPR
jgi:hypothetical protein